MTRRIRCVCRGVVQGVGFRPAVHRLATSLGLAGWDRNDPDGAVVEVEGTEGSVESFRRRIPAELPPLARRHGLDVMEVPPRGEPDFVVLVSAEGIRRTALVPPDAALCGALRFANIELGRHRDGERRLAPALNADRERAPPVLPIDEFNCVEA